jgi:hypothetical protein
MRGADRVMLSYGLPLHQLLSQLICAWMSENSAHNSECYGGSTEEMVNRDGQVTLAVTSRGRLS